MNETINRIFESWRESYFSKDAKAAIEAAHGPEVLAAVMAIYDCLIDLGQGPQSMDESLGAVSLTMSRDYPWLSQEARGRLLHAFVMTWK